jgi:hypothetical protein
MAGITSSGVAAAKAESKLHQKEGSPTSPPATQPQLSTKIAAAAVAGAAAALVVNPFDVLKVRQ